MMNVEAILATLEVTPSGGSKRNLFMLCPFHKDTHPSVSMRRDTGEWTCGKCKLGGDLNRFVKLYSEMVDAKSAGMIDKDIINAATCDVVEEEDIYTEDELEEAKLLIQKYYNYYAEDFLQERGIPEALACHYGLGYNKINKRVLLPCFSLWGDFLGVTGRTVVDERPKYVHTIFDKASVFYAAYPVSPDGDTLLLVEGSFDALNVVKHKKLWPDIAYVIAILGSTITEDLAVKLGSVFQKFITCFDPDEAGKEGEPRTLDKLLPYGLVMKATNKPEDKDVGEYDEDDFIGLKIASYPA